MCVCVGGVLRRGEVRRILAWRVLRVRGRLHEGSGRVRLAGARVGPGHDCPSDEGRNVSRRCGRTRRGENAFVLSCASLRGSALAFGLPFRRDCSAPPAGSPGPSALLPGAGGGPRRWVSGPSGRVAPADCAVSRGAPQGSDPGFLPPKSCPASSCCSQRGPRFPTCFVGVRLYCSFVSFAFPTPLPVLVRGGSVRTYREAEVLCDLMPTL